MAPSGRSTTGVGLGAGSGAAAPSHSGQASPGVGRDGSQLYAHPGRDRIGGNSAARLRTAVDFPVPRSPNTRTPPTLGSTAAIKNAVFIASWPTIAEKG